MSVVSTSENTLEAQQRTPFVRWDLFLLIFLMPFDWLKVPAIGFRSVVWVAMLVPLVRLLLTPETSFRQLLKFLGRAPYVHAAYVVYLLVLMASIFWGPNLDVGISDLSRAIGQFIFYLIVGTTLFTSKYETIARTICFAVPTALVVFAVYCQYVFMAQGDSFVNQLVLAAASGQSNAIAGKVLKNIVNFQFNSMSLDRQVTVTASVRNSLGSTLFIFLFMVLVFSNNRFRSQSELRLGRGFRPIRIGIIVFILCAVFVLMSRANTILLLGAPFVCCAIQLLSRRLISRNSIVLPALLLAFVLGGSVITFLAFGENDFLALNVQRMNEISTDVRFEHYEDIYRLVSRSPWIGYGLGADTPDGRKVHNLFLGLWYRAGVVGLVVSTIFYISILISYVSKSINTQSIAFWLPALLLEPLLRAPLIGGQGGRFCRTEWLAISLFFYFCYATSSRPQSAIPDDIPREISRRKLPDLHAVGH